MESRKRPKVISYRAEAPDNGNWIFWVKELGTDLPKAIAKNATICVVMNKDFLLVQGEYDIGYCPLSFRPKERIARFVYTFISDYLTNEEWIKEALLRLRPNLLGCLYDMPQELVEFCGTINCEVRYLPWFISTLPRRTEKTNIALLSGNIDPNVYMSRVELLQYVTKHLPEVQVSCSGHISAHPLSYAAYHETMGRTRYALVTGVYDRLITLKYYEAASHAACPITFDLPLLSEMGFVDNETCLIINNKEELPTILKSDKWKTIGENACELVRSRHLVQNRANEILEVYHATK